MFQGDELPDEGSTFDAFRGAAFRLDARVEPRDGGGWQVQIPGCAGLTVDVTGEAAFPLAIANHAHTERLALGASEDDSVFEEVLQTRTSLSAGNGRLPDLDWGARAGWVTTARSESKVDLARTDQAKKGWPPSSQLAISPQGTAAVMVRQSLVFEHRQAPAAVTLLLEERVPGLVDVQPKTGPECEPGATATGADVGYRLIMPSAMLDVRLLEAALALVGDEYRTTAPVLQALASHETLARIYLLSRGL